MLSYFSKSCITTDDKKTTCKCFKNNKKINCKNVKPMLLPGGIFGSIKSIFEPLVAKTRKNKRKKHTKSKKRGKLRK